MAAKPPSHMTKTSHVHAGLDQLDVMNVVRLCDYRVVRAQMAQTAKSSPNASTSHDGSRARSVRLSLYEHAMQRAIDGELWVPSALALQRLHDDGQIPSLWACLHVERAVRLSVRDYPHAHSRRAAWQSLCELGLQDCMLVRALQSDATTTYGLLAARAYHPQRAVQAALQRLWAAFGLLIAPSMQWWDHAGAQHPVLRDEVELQRLDEDMAIDLGIVADQVVFAAAHNLDVASDVADELLSHL